MEFRAMRRSGQALSREESLAVLDRGTSGVLAVLGDGDYPYAVPLSYARRGDTLLFHCARSGHKLDAVRRHSKASFCVVDQDQVAPEEYTTYFRSVIAFGTVRVLEDEEEKRAAIEALALRYAPEDTAEHRERYIEKDYAPLCMLEMTIQHLSGKEAKELVRAKKAKGDGQ